MSVLYEATFNVDFSKKDELFPLEVAIKFQKVPGLQWKIWKIDEATQTAGGTYLFESREAAENWANGGAKELPKRPGITNFQSRIFEIVDEHSRLNNAPLDIPANSY